jgi:hypothetical protein
VTHGDFDDYWRPLATNGQAFSRHLRVLPEGTQRRLRDAVRAAYLGPRLGDRPRFREAQHSAPR